MLLFLKERKHEFPQNISKLNEQESTFADHITENSPEEISDFRGWEGSAGADGRWLGRGAVEMSIDVNEAIMWYVGNDSSATIQTATGPPVIAEGYQDNSRLSDYYSIGRIIRMESYPTRFLTARQERTEVVTRAGLVFSI